MSKQVQKDPKSSPTPPDKSEQEQPSQQPPPQEPSHDPKVVIRVEESDKSGNDKELNE